jgi:hypothetical protein
VGEWRRALKDKSESGWEGEGARLKDKSLGGRREV